MSPFGGSRIKNDGDQRAAAANCQVNIFVDRRGGVTVQTGARERKISWGKRGAESVEGRSMVTGCPTPLPIRLGRLRERHELFQRGLGLRRKTNLVHSDACRRPLVLKIH